MNAKKKFTSGETAENRQLDHVKPFREQKVRAVKQRLLLPFIALISRWNADEFLAKLADQSLVEVFPVDYAQVVLLKVVP